MSTSEDGKQDDFRSSPSPCHVNLAWLSKYYGKQCPGRFARGGVREGADRNSWERHTFSILSGLGLGLSGFH